MKFAYTVLSILVTLLLVSGCSGDKTENYKNKNVVRKAVKKPVPKTEPRAKTKKETTEIVKKAPEQKIVQEPAGEMNEERPEEKILPAQEAEKEEIVEGPKAKMEEKLEKARKTENEDATPAAEAGVYITKEGDTLSGISGRADIYNNPLKWPLLYRDNREALSGIKNKSTLFETGLPGGIRLKIVTKEEVKKNLENRSGYYYVANLISAPSMKEIAPQVVKLIDSGYFIYISSAVVNDKEWYRVRAGFFKTRSEANNEGDKIRNDLHIPDIWTVKIGDIEFHEFGGY